MDALLGYAEGVLFSFAGLGQHGPVKLILTDFKLLYESVKAGMKGSLLQTNINDTRKIDLKYNQNSFSISFSAINFMAPHRIRYEYIGSRGTMKSGNTPIQCGT